MISAFAGSAADEGLPEPLRLTAAYDSGVRSLFARRSLAAALGACGALVAIAVPAQAQPAPNCTAADLAGVATGVSAATSAYLFTHPPVNEFFTSLLDLGPDEKKTAVIDYMGANPQIEAELRGIRQPLVDFRHRCHYERPQE